MSFDELLIDRVTVQYKTVANDGIGGGNAPVWHDFAVDRPCRLDTRTGQLSVREEGEQYYYTHEIIMRVPAEGMVKAGMKAIIEDNEFLIIGTDEFTDYFTLHHITLKARVLNTILA